MGKKLTHEQFVQKLHAIHPNYEILSDYKNVRSLITMKCEHGHVWTTKAGVLLYHGGCPTCGIKRRSKFISENHYTYNEEKCLKNTNQVLAQYVRDPDDALKYSSTSGRSIYWVCPYCRYEFKHRIIDFNRRSFSCPRCMHGHYFPNRFMRSILDCLQVDFEAEYSFYDVKQYKFDFFIPSKHILIEMDGGFHYCDNYKNGCSLSEQQKIDASKDLVAIDHGIKLIRIDCNYKDMVTRTDYIKNKILESELVNIFDFNNLDFNECARKCMLPTHISICKDWNDGIQDINALCSKYQLNRVTVRKYLKFGASIGACTYNVEHEIQRRYNKISVKLYCLENNTYYKSISNAERNLKCRIKKINNDEYVSCQNKNCTQKYHFKKNNIDNFNITK